MFSRVNHIAIAVKDLPATLKFYEESFGLKASAISEFPSQGVKIASIVVGDLKLEFLSPLGQDSPISNFLATRGDGLHHLTFESSSLDDDIERIKAKGIRTIGNSPSIGYDGEPIIFLHPKDTRGVLIELEQARTK